MLSQMLCRIGIHRPVTPGEWHLGYCFTHCRRCNSAMVKSVLSGWKVPKKLRVVRGKPNAVLNLDRELTRREAVLNKSTPAADKPAEESAADADPAPRDTNTIELGAPLPDQPTPTSVKISVSENAAPTPPPVPEAPPRTQVEEVAVKKVAPAAPASPAAPPIRLPAPAPENIVSAAAPPKVAVPAPKIQDGSPFDFSDFDGGRRGDGQGEASTSEALRQAQ